MLSLLSGCGMALELVELTEVHDVVPTNSTVVHHDICTVWSICTRDGSGKVDMSKREVRA